MRDDQELKNEKCVQHFQVVKQALITFVGNKFGAAYK